MKAARFSKLGAMVLTALLMLAAGGCGASSQGGGAGTDGGGKAQATVVYGGSSWLGHYPAMVGIGKNLFGDQGIRVAFQSFGTSSGRMSALAAGQLDFAGTGAISALALMAAGNKSFYLLATPDSYATVEGIIAKKGIQSIKDLKGMKIGVTFASSAHVLVYDILEQNGMDASKDVKLINMDISDMPSAIRSGEIDAVAVWTPAFEKVLALPDMHVVVDDTQFSLYKKYQLGPGPDVLVVRKEFADKSTDLARKFLVGYFAAIDFINKDSDGSATIIKDYTQLSLEQQKQTLSTLTWHGLGKQKELMSSTGPFIQGLDMLAQFLIDHKQLDKKPDVRSYLKADLLPQ